MLTEAIDLLREINAKPQQWVWVIKRIGTTSDAEAARQAHVHPVTVSKWHEKPQLDQAVLLLLHDPVQAAQAILINAAPEAARTLERNLRGRQQVQSANSILDRVGLTGTTHIDVTSKGESVAMLIRRALDGAGDNTGASTATAT